MSTVQPNYTAWRRIKPGMTRAKVIALLGEPPKAPFFMFPPHVTYGWLDIRIPHRHYPYCFTIGYDASDRVSSKDDPFRGVLSRNGAPTQPTMIAPPHNARFDHYPRLLDLRWTPSSGVYPMTYTVEVGIAVPGTTQFHRYFLQSGLTDPHIVLNLPGSQPVRARVRARNAKGLGR